MDNISKVFHLTYSLKLTDTVHEASASNIARMKTVMRSSQRGAGAQAHCKIYLVSYLLQRDNYGSSFILQAIKNWSRGRPGNEAS